MITVCKDCPKRHVGCHGECTLYKTERRLLDKENARKRAENAAFDSVSFTMEWNWRYQSFARYHQNMLIYVLKCTYL